MTRTYIKIFVVVFVLSLATASFGAAVQMIFSSSVYGDAKGNGLKLPEGVACRGNVLVVADTGNGRLLKYTVDGSTVKGGQEIKVAEATDPVKVQINSKGDIFVLDGKLHRIARLSPEGAFKGYIDPAGVPSPSEFITKSFKIDGADNIYILDVFSGRVLVLDPSGKYVRQVAFPENYGFITDLAVDQKGDIYLLDGADARVYEAQGDGSKGFSAVTKDMEQDMNFPANMIVDNSGQLYLADQNGGGVVVLGPDGSFRGRPIVFGWKEGLVRYPAELSINENGVFFVADRENSRVQVYTLVK